MKNFLEENQIKELTQKEWEVRPKCFYNIIYRDEVPSKVWNSLCRISKVSSDCTEIKLLSVGVATK